MADDDILKGLERQTRVDPQLALFESVDKSWEAHWWDMPAFIMGDARPSYQITMNFMTHTDLMAFADRIGARVSERTKSLWYPEQGLEAPRGWAYVDEK